MNRLLVIFLLLLPAAGFSQNFLGKSKNQVKKILQKKIRKSDSLVITMTDKDSILIYNIKAGKTWPGEFRYSFNASGKCRSEKVIAGCDSCFRKYLQTLLDQKKYAWKKINENQYVSNYSSRMMIELPAENKDFIYTLFRMDWSKELYAMLSGN